MQRIYKSNYCLDTRIFIALTVAATFLVLSREPVGLQDPPTITLHSQLDETEDEQKHDTCAAIFNIGQRGDLFEDEDLNDLLVSETTTMVENIWRAKEEGIIDEELHRSLAMFLPKLLRDNETLSSDLANVAPRLSLLDGRIPYLPCRLQEVDSQFLQKCIQHRRTKKRLDTWIAFVGDSKMRKKFEYLFLSMRHLDWNITVWKAREKRVVDFEEAVKLLDWKWHDSIDAVSRREPDVRLSLVWDTHVIYTLPFGNRVEELFAWAYRDVPVPNVVVMGIGTWMATEVYVALKERKERSGVFEETDLIIRNWRKARPLLKALASKTLVLLWTQSRFRDHIETTPDPNITRANSNDMLQAHLYFKDFRMGNMNLIDMAMWYAGRNTGAVLWDSSLPFNLANTEECSVGGQGKKHGEDPPDFYSSSWWACNDIHHNSDNTHHAEATMIWNYLCNQVIPPSQNAQEYCCT